jgi:hypothetical protein
MDGSFYFFEEKWGCVLFFTLKVPMDVLHVAIGFAIKAVLRE